MGWGGGTQKPLANSAAIVILCLAQARTCAEVVKLVDALRSGRSSLFGSVGSNPTFGTKI